MKKLTDLKTPQARDKAVNEYDWRTIPLYDSDGGRPDSEQRIRAMREFRAHGCIQGYWFFNPVTATPEDPDNPDSRVWDEYNNEYRSPWDCGPASSDIDYSGLPEGR